MKENLEKRLAALKTEFESGQQVLAELETKQANVRETLLRISGAIQVLEELLQEEDPAEAADGAEAIAPASQAANGHSEMMESLTP